jgi:ATP-dependent DNA helicase DinG
MGMLSWLKVPFRYTTQEDFARKLSAWLADVFYERLPQHGFEVREEQIYSAFRIAQALCQRRAIFAEAGSGTGKTFAYLLPGLCYARMQGKPLIISSASATLQQQLVGPQGDIATLSRLLGLGIDARLAKDPHNHLCRVRLQRLNTLGRKPRAERLLLRWGETTQLGDRAEIPEISDELWEQVAWNETLFCDRCRHRGYCHVAEMRRHFWGAQDFIVTSHDIYFQHLWGRRERLAEKLTPYLPDHSGVIFDEGHLVEPPALRHLGHPLRAQTVTDVQRRLEFVGGLRLQVTLSLEKVAELTQQFFAEVAECVQPDPESARWFVAVSDRMKHSGRQLADWLEEVSDQITIDSGVAEDGNTVWDLHDYVKRFDRLIGGLRLLCDEERQAVVWWEPAQSILWVLPLSFSQLLGAELGSERLPLVFTSATLQAGDAFASMHRLVGLPGALHSQVTTSFDLARQVKIYLPAEELSEFTARAERCLELLQENGGRALVLFNSLPELRRWREFARDQDLDFPLYWEGEGERSWLLERFRSEESAVLSGADFWEGVDIPGDALTLLIIWSLPYPWRDPLVEAKRRLAAAAGLDPFQAVDLPAMLLKLRQGCGRLIRKATDRGTIAILDVGENQRDLPRIMGALPPGSPVLRDAQKALRW